VGFSEALLLGLASDGGLFVPETIPTPGLSAHRASLPEIAEQLLSPFLAEDRLATSLPDICRATFSFPIPLRELDADTSVLELFHGPTAAFKDVGARFLAECVTTLRADNPRPATVLVATSGDTGGAVAAAFY